MVGPYRSYLGPAYDRLASTFFIIAVLIVLGYWLKMVFAYQDDTPSWYAYPQGMLHTTPNWPMALWKATGHVMGTIFSYRGCWLFLWPFAAALVLAPFSAASARSQDQERARYEWYRANWDYLSDFERQEFLIDEMAKRMPRYPPPGWANPDRWD